jgi:teichuronic acid biosynthesis glycosyltransferase TuaH
VNGLDGDWSGLVVVAAATAWDGSRLVDQHVAAALTRHAPVLYVDPPRPWYPGRAGTAPGRSDRAPLVGAPDLTLVAPRLARLRTPVLPTHQRPGSKALTLALVRRSMRRAVQALGGPDVEAVIVNSLDALLGACGERRRVLYVSDDYVAGGALMRIAAGRLRRQARQRLAEADLVVAASPALADGLRADGAEPLLVPNGCDWAAFAGTDEVPPAPDVAPTRPAAGLVGHLSERIDARHLDALARRGVPLLLVGPAPARPTGALAAVLGRPGVTWVGPRPFEQLPSYLAHVDVGLVPYADTPFNRASFPLKALEYLAAGRPVACSAIDSLRRLRDEAGGELTDDDVALAATPEEFADQAERLMLNGLRAEHRERRRRFAQHHGWDRRVAELADALDLRSPSPAKAGT